jgi:hypothetical protein
MSRLKPRVAFLLLALWLPETSYILGLIAMAQGEHHVSLLSSHGSLAVVLHHHDVDHADDAIAFEADDHPHGDHVVRGQRIGAVANRIVQPGALVVQARSDLGEPPVPNVDLLPIGAFSKFGPAPPLRTIVLRI